MADKHIEFSIYPQEFINSSQIVIKHGSGADQGVASLALGSIGFAQPCMTCGLVNKCPGHIGKLEISEPVFKSGFKKVSETLFKIICPVCGHIRIQKLNDILTEIDNEGVITTRHRKMYNEWLLSFKMPSKSICANSFCNVLSSHIKYVKNNIFVFTTDTLQELPNHKIYSYLKQLPQNLRRLMRPNGDFRPEDMFYNEFIMIPSNYVRPPNMYGNSVSEPLTTDLNNMVRVGKKIQKEFDTIDGFNKPNPYAVNNKLSLSLLTNGTSKESYLRCNINGKRVPGTGRAVIGPGIDLKIGEVDIPNYITEGLRDVIYFNRITESYILNELKKSNDKRSLRLLNYIKEDSNKQTPVVIVSLKDNHKIVAPRYGEAFEYPKEEGGYIMFGRQPSLHKFNLQSSIIRKKKVNAVGDNNERTVNINISTASSFNGDFDGDEMTLKVFSNPAANIELGLLLNSRNLLKHPLTGTTIFGFVQDQIVGTNLLLQEKDISRKEAYRILGEYSFLLTTVPTKKVYDGYDIISLIFPKHYTLKGVVEDGRIIVPKIMTNMVSGNSYKSIFNGVSQYYDNFFALEVIDMFKHIVQNYLKYFGLSIRMNDIVPDESILSDLKIDLRKNLDLANGKINEVLEDMNSGKLDIISKDEFSDFKIRNGELINQKMKKMVDSKIEKYYNDPSNQFKKCYDMEYKLKPKDMITLLGCTGQIRNKKGIPTPGINGKTLLYGRQNDLSMESSGFISNSLLSGLTYNQYSTVIKYESLPQIVEITSGTGEAGYLGKKMVKIMSEITINSDRFMVSQKHIIQPNPNFLKISMEDTARVDLFLPRKEMVWYNEIRDLFEKKVRPYFIQKKSNSVGYIKEVDFYLNMYSEVMTNYYATKNTELTPVTHKQLYDNILYFYNVINARFFFRLNETSIILYILLTYLDPSGIVYEKKGVGPTITLSFFENLCEKITNKLLYSLNKGMMFGYEIANTLQERFTQQSLSAFHATTKSGSNVERGILGDFKRLIDLPRKDKEDITVFCAKDKETLQKLKNAFEFISLKNIAKSIDIVSEDAEKKSVIYAVKMNTGLLINKQINYGTIWNMFVTYLNRCFVISEYFLFPSTSEDGTEFIMYIKVSLKTNTNKLDLLFNQAKYILKSSLWDGIHKGKQINSNLSIDPLESVSLDDDYKIKKETIFELKLFVEGLSDFENIKTSDLLYISLPPWLSFATGGIQYMKNNTIGKVQNILNDDTFTNATKHFFDFRFASSKSLGMKSLYNKEEIVKLANHGFANNMFHIAAYENKKDPCNDVYSSLLVSQRPQIGHNTYKFMINPNLFDKLSLSDKIMEEREIDDNEDVVSFF